MHNSEKMLPCEWKKEDQEQTHALFLQVYNIHRKVQEKQYWLFKARETRCLGLGVRWESSLFCLNLKHKYSNSSINIKE